MPDNNRNKSKPQVIESCHQCLLWLIPQLDKFPRNRRFTLGEKIETNLLNTLALLTGAMYSQDKKRHLEQANQRVAICQHLWRLAYELKVIDKRRYYLGSKLLVNIGRQLGGWIKTCSN